MLTFILLQKANIILLHVIFASFNEHCLKLWVFLTVLIIVAQLLYCGTCIVDFTFQKCFINFDHTIHYTQRSCQELFPLYFFYI